MVAIRGHFDGKVFVPDEPVASDLPQNQPLVLRVEVLPVGEQIRSSADDEPKDAWDALERHIGSIDGPPDWSIEHDHYLYGTPKRGGDASK